QRIYALRCTHRQLLLPDRTVRSGAVGATIATEEQNHQPILNAGGGIEGVAAAYALACKGFPVRVLEQAPEFKELGAGIQLGPNIFRALERIGPKDAVLADAH